MENIKIEIKWAIIFVLTTLAWVLIEKFSGLYAEHIDKQAMISNFFMIPAISIYVFALIDKRNNFYGGSINYKQAFISGLFISGFVTLISPLTQYIAVEWIGPEYFPNMSAHNVEQGVMTQPEAEKYYSLKSFIIEGLIATPLMGILTTAIVAIFIRRKKSIEN